jgi:hypothetical protein
MKNQFLSKFADKFKPAAKHFKTFAVVFLVVILICYAIYAFFRFSYINNRDTAMDKINSTVLTLADVMGENLPPKPDQAVNDSTIEGIDANNNMVRDDVELAIFEKYPNSAKMRAALLQYAQALQLELTAVNSEEIMKNALVKDSAANSCLFDVIKIYNNSDEWSPLYQAKEDIKTEFDSLILNTEIRKNQYEVVYKKYMVSFTLSDKRCDIDVSTLLN